MTQLSPISVRAVDDAGLADIRAKVEAGVRLSFEDGVRLFQHRRDRRRSAALANLDRERRCGDLTFFNRNLHVNATNVCEASCIFCSFARLKTGDADAYTMALDEAVGRVRALPGRAHHRGPHRQRAQPRPAVVLLHRTCCARSRQERPDLHIKGFTAVEIHYFAEKYGMTYEQVLTELVDAGPRARCPAAAPRSSTRAPARSCAHDKVDADGWLEVHRIAHRMGLRTNCTMLFGRIETVEERVDHLLRLRDAAGRDRRLPDVHPAEVPQREQPPRAPAGADRRRLPAHLAVSRLMLDNIDAHQGVLGDARGQARPGVARASGVDDLDGTVREERIYHMAGAKTPQELTRAELVQLIRRAGRIPVERDTLYNVVAEA